MGQNIYHTNFKGSKAEMFAKLEGKRKRTKSGLYKTRKKIDIEGRNKAVEKFNKSFGLRHGKTADSRVSYGLGSPQQKREQNNQEKKIRIRRHLKDVIPNYKPPQGLGLRSNIWKKQKVEAAWEKNYLLLKEYKDKYGHINVPRRRFYKYKGEPLGKWLRKQEQAIKNGKLSQEKSNKLYELGPHIRVSRLGRIY